MIIDGSLSYVNVEEAGAPNKLTLQQVGEWIEELRGSGRPRNRAKEASSPTGS